DTYGDGPSNPFGTPNRIDSQQISVYATYTPTPAAPVNTGLPVVSGSAVQGQTLSASTGSWSNSPTGYAYQWRDCDGSGGSCVDIAGATSSSYVLVASDVNSTVRVAVTASNAGGSNTASSAQTAVVQPGTSTGNPIVVENQQPGTNQWQLGNAATDTGGEVKGYASATSVNKGESLTFYVSVNPAQTYSIDIYRMGWYQGLGGRLMQHIGPLDG